MHVRGGFGKGGEEVEVVQALEAARPMQARRDRVDAVVVGGLHPRADLAEALVVVFDEFDLAVVESGEAEAVRRQNGHVLVELADLLQRAQVVAEAVRDRAGIETDVRGDRRQHVVSGEEQFVLVADEHRVSVGVPRRPHGRHSTVLEREFGAVVEDMDVLGQLAHRLFVQVHRVVLRPALARSDLEALDFGPAVFGDSVDAGDIEVRIDAGAEVDGIGVEAFDRAQVLAVHRDPRIRILREQRGSEPDVVAVVMGDRETVDIGNLEAEIGQRRGERQVLVLAVPARVDEDDTSAVGDGIAIGVDEGVVRDRDRKGPDSLGDFFHRRQDAILPCRRLLGTERFDRHTSLTPLMGATLSVDCNLLRFR